jgi:hypothetical protein
VGVYHTGSSPAAGTPVKILHAGEPLGEMALLTNSARTATIKAETECEVLRLDRSSFLDLVREQPGVALSIAATLSRRLAAMPGQPDEVDAVPVARTDSQARGSAAEFARPRRRPRRGAIAMVAAMVILALGWTSPPPSGLSEVAWHALVVLLAALPALALEALLEGVSNSECLGHV